MFYSSEADALQEFLRDKLGCPHTDVGGGWLIFDAPEAGQGPPSGTADVSFYRDDLETTVAELKSRGVEFSAPVENQGYGLVTRFKVPGGFS